MRSSLTRVVTLLAWHHYYRPDWSAEENAQHFGDLSDPRGHDHVYRMEATISGPLHPRASSVMELEAFDLVLHEEIVAPLTDQHLNQVIPEFASGAQQPTCEALAVWCFGRVARRLPDGVRLDRLRVAESDTLWAECAGPS